MDDQEHGRNGPARGRGRPPGNDDSGLRDRLLNIAEERFAEQGFAATTVREIAQAAGVNPAMVHYYFGSKQALLIAVMDRVFEPLAGAVAGLREAESVSLDAVIDLLYDTFREHPALPRLIVREVMLNAGELRERFIRDYAPRLGAALPPLLRREQDRGRLCSDLDPRVLTLSIMGLCVFPFVARAVSEPALGLAYDAEGIEHLRAQVGRLLAAGTMAP